MGETTREPGFSCGDELAHEMDEEDDEEDFFFFFLNYFSLIFLTNF